MSTSCSAVSKFAVTWRGLHSLSQHNMQECVPSGDSHQLVPPMSAFQQDKTQALLQCVWAQAFNSICKVKHLCCPPCQLNPFYQLAMQSIGCCRNLLLASWHIHLFSHPLHQVDSYTYHGITCSLAHSLTHLLTHSLTSPPCSPGRHLEFGIRVSNINQSTCADCTHIYMASYLAGEAVTCSSTQTSSLTISSARLTIVSASLTFLQPD